MCVLQFVLIEYCKLCVHEIDKASIAHHDLVGRRVALEPDFAHIFEQNGLFLIAGRYF